MDYSLIQGQNCILYLIFVDYQGKLPVVLESDFLYPVSDEGWVRQMVRLWNKLASVLFREDPLTKEQLDNDGENTWRGNGSWMGIRVSKKKRLGVLAPQNFGNWSSFSVSSVIFFCKRFYCILLDAWDCLVCFWNVFGYYGKGKKIRLTPVAFHPKS